MEELLTRIWENLGGRIGGPLTLRFIFQPLIATSFAVRDGLRDAKQGKPAYLWTVASDPSHRKELLTQGWKSVGKVFIIAMILDLVYQFKVFDRIYPLELVIVAALLALTPYMLLRGPVNRIARAFQAPKK